MRQGFLGEATVTEQPAPTSLFEQARQEGGPSEEAAVYVLKYDLTAKQVAANVERFIDGDSDFILVSIHGKSTGSYNVQFRTNSTRPIESAPADAVNLVGNAQIPRRIRPGLFYPAAGKIGIYLEDTSNAPNSIELVFTGIRKFRTR